MGTAGPMRVLLYIVAAAFGVLACLFALASALTAWVWNDGLTGVNLGYWLGTEPGTRYYVTFPTLAVISFLVAMLAFVGARRLRWASTWRSRPRKTAGLSRQ